MDYSCVDVLYVLILMLLLLRLLSGISIHHVVYDGDDNYNDNFCIAFANGMNKSMKKQNRTYTYTLNRKRRTSRREKISHRYTILNVMEVGAHVAIKKK